MSGNRQIKPAASRLDSRTVIRTFLVLVVAFHFNALIAVFAADDPKDDPGGRLLSGPNTYTGLKEKAVGAALYWLARHQAPEGNWSLKDYTKQCKDKTCTGTGTLLESPSAATAMGVLPFLAAGQTQKVDGPFRMKVGKGIDWIVNHQKPDGDLSAGEASQMYSHGLAAIALCEDYGMTQDKTIGAAAQKAIDFIENAQNQHTGGWRYHPGEEGDTSVLGWQMTALKSAQLAGLNVKPATLDGAKKWLASVSKKDKNGVPTGEFSYMPDGVATETMSAVGLLCNQYLKAPRTDPLIVGGVKYLMANQPDDKARNVYYWFYATRAMHNMADKDWDTWNRQVRKILVASQDHEGCAAGSWKPTSDFCGAAGGRVMATSFSCLTLEIYYRYPPLFKLDKPAEKEQQR